MTGNTMFELYDMLNFIKEEEERRGEALLSSSVSVKNGRLLCSSKSYAVASGTYPENFTEKPVKGAVSIQIRFSLLPNGTNSSIHRASEPAHGFAVGALGVTEWTDHEIVNMFGRPNPFLINEVRQNIHT